MIFDTKFCVLLSGLILYLPFKSEAVKGCITIKIDDKGKECICSRLTTKFSRIPVDLPEFVMKLEVKHQNIHTLSGEQLSKLSWLVELNLDTNKLSSIETEAFVNVPKLKILSLKNNFLILGGNSFPTASLTHLKTLRFLNLENNPLGFVPDFYFQPLKALQKLTLSRAPSGFYVESNGLAGLPSLEVLDLSFSHFTTLDREIETSLRYMQLHEFYIFGNPWSCDCNIKWLKKWYLRFKEVKLVKHFTRANGEKGIAQPQCSSPTKYKGRNLFETVSSYDFLKLGEMHCAPKILTQNQQVQVDRGKNLTLTCEFDADPGGDVTWSKNGLVVLKHWQRIRWSRTLGIKFTSSLIISNTDFVDNGLWRCILVTVIDRANATFNVRVRNNHPVQIDLSIILKYIGIGAVTLILLLVIIGIAIYCIYGFKIRPFNKQTKPSSGTDRAIRPSQAGNQGTERNQAVNSFRPMMVDALPTQDDSQKCLLLPTSPTMLIPVSSNQQFPCPLHGNINFMHSGSFHENKQHMAMDYSDSVGLLQPHTFPRQNHVNKVRASQVNRPDPNQMTACPLHGHILASLQGDENDNINAIYSTFFSPRHSQPLATAYSPRTNHIVAHTNKMSTSATDTAVLVPINDTFSTTSTDHTQPCRNSNNPVTKKLHDDEGYSTSV